MGYSAPCPFPPMTRDLHPQMLNRILTDKLPLPQEEGLENNMRGQDLYNKETDQNKIKTCLSFGASTLRIKKKHRHLRTKHKNIVVISYQQNGSSTSA